MFLENDLVTIKPKWMEKNDSLDHVYIVTGDESEYGAVKIMPTWDTGLPFTPINTVKAECLNLLKGATK